MQNSFKYNVPQMRTLPEAAKELKNVDPGTRLTLPVLRRLTKEGVIPCVYTGRRALVDMTELKDYLRKNANRNLNADRGIRKVSETNPHGNNR